MSLFFGAERTELKNRMERIIEAEVETVKTMKKNIEALVQQKLSIEKLVVSIDAHKAVMDKICAKL